MHVDELLLTFYLLCKTLAEKEGKQCMTLKLKNAASHIDHSHHSVGLVIRNVIIYSTNSC